MKQERKFLLIFFITIISLEVFIGCANTKNAHQNHVEPAINAIDQQTETKKDFIYATERKNTKDTLTLLDHTNIDMDKNGQEESIELYTAAQKDSTGEIAWDDGQRWLLTVIDGNNEYILFDNYVQLGNLNYWVYTSDQNTVHITTIQNCNAEFIVTDYIFDSNKKRFERSVPFRPRNINMLYYSH